MKNFPPPPPPPGFDPDTLFAGIHWHQRWEIFQGVWLPGRAPIGDLLAHARVPEDLGGLRVLDIGAFNGGYTFECERRGATCVAYDVLHPDHTGFNRIKALIGSKAEYVFGSVYDLHRHDLGRFDIVLFFGVLYHLRYPLLALDQLRGLDCRTLLVESFVIDHATYVGDPPAPARLADVAPALAHTPVFQFYPGAELQGDRSNWFGPSIKAVEAGLQTAGFDTEVLAAWGDRAMFRATPGQKKLKGSYEGDLEVVARSVGLKWPGP